MRILLAILLVVAVQPCVAADYAIVVAANSSIQSLDERKARDIFLRKRNFEADVRVVPVNLLGDDSTRREFEVRVLQMDLDEINRYWITSHFNGLSPPTTQASLQSVKAFVQSVEGAIGYLPIEMVDSGLKILYEF